MLLVSYRQRIKTPEIKEHTNIHTYLNAVAMENISNVHQRRANVVENKQTSSDRLPTHIFIRTRGFLSRLHHQNLRVEDHLTDVG